MKHVKLFDDFLRDTVNLNTTRIDSLENSVEAIKNFIAASDWTPNIREWMAQGSWAHKTIIKPVDAGEFDADLIVFVDPVDGWTAKDYLNNLYLEFRGSPVYQNKVRRWSHCVTITYANEKKIDIAPCILDRSWDGSLEVCNRDSDEYEYTEPKRYTDWLIERNTWSGANSFRKVTRVIKYLRDIKTTFKCSSILLTTMLGYRMSSTDRYGSEFVDTPTALKTIFSRWDDWLASNYAKPRVNNPFVDCDFASDLTDVQYDNLKKMVSKYRGWIDDAYAETDRNESIAKWRRVFGDEFAKNEVIEEAKSVSKNAVLLLKEAQNLVIDATADLVSLVKRFGGAALPSGFNNLPHMKRPTWRVATNANISVQVKVELYQSKGYNKLCDVNSLQSMPSNHWIRFRATAMNGLPFPKDDYEVHWRITNTDSAAYRANCLRGGFERSDTHGEKWEQLAYRGVHPVEAFVVRKRDNNLVAKSAPFYVTVE